MIRSSIVAFGTLVVFTNLGWGSPSPNANQDLGLGPLSPLKFSKALTAESLETTGRGDAPVIFDIPMAYNSDVRFWIRYYQNAGRPHFKRWLERSARYLPRIQKILYDEGLPRDLAYMAMIESGFSSHAVSTASAVGPWQFIQETAERYHLRVNWWIDERKDFDKSTHAAAKYLRFLYSNFKAWHLVAAGYNTGENRVLKLINRHGTKNFWALSNKGVLAEETRQYVPKLIAATLIAKAPNLYGFREVVMEEPLTFDHFFVPGGTDLKSLADHLKITPAFLAELNPELNRGMIPSTVSGHMIRIPKGSIKNVSQYVRKSLASTQ